MSHSISLSRLILKEAVNQAGSSAPHTKSSLCEQKQVSRGIAASKIPGQHWSPSWKSGEDLQPQQGGVLQHMELICRHSCYKAAGALLKTNAQVYKITAFLGCFLHLGTLLSFLWYELLHLVQLTCCTSSRWFNKNRQPANNANSVSALKRFTCTRSVFKANDWFEVNAENGGSLHHRNPRAFVNTVHVH